MTNGVSKSELFPGLAGLRACGVFYDMIREAFISIHSFTFVFGQQTFFLDNDRHGVWLGLSMCVELIGSGTKWVSDTRVG